MKTIYLILSLLMIPFFINGQEPGKGAVVSAVKMNVLYRGISNPVEIAVPGVTTDKVSASMTNGTIDRVANGWEVIPGKQAESIITVSVNNKKISEKNFRVKDIPEPVAVFAGINNGVISINSALKIEVLEAQLPDFVWDIKFAIKSFNFFMPTETGDIEIPSDGYKLTDKMKSMISGIKRGQTIVFKDIKSVAPDGKIMELNPIVLKIE
jgi:gliding motility-associated protein GldM